MQVTPCSRGETGRHGGAAAAAWVPYGRQQGETGRHAGVEAGVWASYGAAAWKTQDAMQEQEHGLAVSGTRERQDV